MAKGPTPKPTALKILEGAQPCRINRDEPRPAEGVPNCPQGLSGKARAEWKRVCAILTACRVLTQADRAALAAYCQCWQRWWEAEAVVTKEGQVLTRTNEQGSVVSYVHPAVGVAHRAVEQMRRLMQELGLTPASRTRIRVEAAGSHPGGEGAVPVRDRTGAG